MSKQKKSWIAAAVGLLVIGAVGVAGATGSGGSTEDGDETQSPKYESSVTVDQKEHEGFSEAEESKSLEPLAKITADDAKKAATAELPGKVTEVELENENGALVYEVEIGDKEVKVDAGNGDILHTESDDDEPGHDDDEAGHDDDGRGGDDDGPDDD